MQKEELDRIAKQMLADYDAHTPGTMFADGLRLALNDAWAVQSAVADLREQRGEDVVGYKIGCVCENNQRANGLTHPVWGRLWSTEQHGDGVELDKKAFANVAMEAEFAITLNRSVGPESAGTDELVDAVDKVYPVIELHNLIFRGSAPTGHELIANNAIHAGVVRGQGVAVPDLLSTTDLALIFDNETVDAWSDVVWPRDMLSAVKWLAEQLRLCGRALNEGDLILIGALGPPIALEEGARVDVTSSAFGHVSATFR